MGLACKLDANRVGYKLPHPRMAGNTGLLPIMNGGMPPGHGSPLPTMRTMMPTPPMPAAPRPVDATDQELCLMGATRMADFIDFVRERAIGGRDMDPGDLADMWRDAAEVFHGLQTAEAGAADKPDIRPLSKTLQKHVDRLVKLDSFAQTFSSVPVAFGMVELDKLVVCQQHVGRASVDRMVDRLPRPLSDTDLASVCLPLTAAPASFRLAHRDEDRFVFVSDTHDARFLGTQVLAPGAIQGLKVNGHPQAVVALAVGFTTNVLNVVRYGQRVVLNNGYHRALALRELGVTHAPCLIQVCSHWEDVGLAGSGEMYHNGPVYFSSARPPLLRDFADARLVRPFATRKLTREIRLKYEVDTLQLAL